MVTLSVGKIGSSFGVRHLQVFLAFLCCTISYFIRINTSVAVVAMTNKNTANPDFEEFDWSVKEKSYILSSFFWGYVVTQLPGGYIAQKYGAKYVLLLSVLIPSLLNMITPLSVQYGGWEMYSVIRIIQGICQGVIFPAFHTFLSKWSPSNEINSLGGICHSGLEFGTVLAFGVTGLIAASPLGWPGISYVSGISGLIWSIIWFFLGANNPSESKIISLAEKEYIESSLNNAQESAKAKTKNTPWIKIITSIPFLALLATRVGFAWGLSTLLTQIPSYMHYILKMDIQNNALYSAIPYIVMLLVSYGLILLSNIISKKELLSLEVIRKVLNTLAMWGPGLALISIGFINADQSALAVVLLTIGVGTNGANTLGSVLNHIDLAPNYSGVLMGITNTFGNVMSILAPLMVGIVVTDLESRAQWQIIFSIAGVLLIIGNLVYIIFGKMEAQSWNEPSINISINEESSLECKNKTASSKDQR